jgi:hypothetical protein
MGWTNDGKAISDPVAWAQDQAYHDNKAADERKKRACNDIMCNFEYSQRCSQDPEKCDYWFEREIEQQERKREGDR